MTPFILGVDMAKCTFEVHLQEHHRPAKTRGFDNTQDGLDALGDWLDALSEGESVVLGVESTSTYHLPLVSWALEKGYTVFLLNPDRVLAHLKSESPRHKNDELDACAIAEFVRQKQHKLRPYEPGDAAWRELRGLSRRRAQLLKQRTREKNRLEALAASQPQTKESIERHLLFLKEELERLERACRCWIESHESVRSELDQLAQIPGIGPTVARTVATELGSLRSYGDAKELTARVGLVPFERRSGTSVRGRSRLKRGGNPRVRSALYMAALTACRLEAWRPWIERRKEQGKTGKRLLVAIMDKYLRLMFGVVKTGRAFDEVLAFSS